jgi:NADH-quinone oxidoreductase subunit J
VSEAWVFWVAAVVALGSALGMVQQRNGVHAALLLVLNLMSLAVLFVVLEAQFLGVVQLIVYAGAIMVLFLFVIMLLGVDRMEDLNEKHPAPLVAAIFALLLAGGLLLVLRYGFGGAEFADLAVPNRPGNVQALGRLLFRRYVFPFEFTSVLLIVAAIAGMVLGRSRDEEERASHIDAHTTDVHEMAEERA